jgi:hypothetical protein
MNKRDPGYEIEDMVQMLVTEKERKIYKKFTIADSKLVADHWKYQLNDPITKSLYEAGGWFPESSLTNSM